MKTIFAAIIISMFWIAVASAGSLATGSYKGKWKLIFDDEFNGTTLDTTKWWPNYYGSTIATITEPLNHTPTEVAAYDPAQCSVRGGNLNLTTVSNTITINGRVYPNRTCFVWTYVYGNQFMFRYGYVEARIKFPSSLNAAVNWPAWWMTGTNPPISGEMDIAEVLSGGVTPSYVNNKQAFLGTPPAGFSDGTYTEAFHIYSVLWEPGILRYYYDGKLVNSYTNTTTGGFNGFGGFGVSQMPVQLVLNNAMGIFGGVNTPNVSMQVDWVHVYTRYPQYYGPGDLDWYPSFAYFNGQAVSVNGNVYTETVASCTSASSGFGPTGRGTAISDGTCSWNFVSVGHGWPPVKPQPGYSGMSMTPN